VSTKNNRPKTWKKILITFGGLVLLVTVASFSISNTEAATPLTDSTAKKSSTWDVVYLEDKVASKQEIQISTKSTNRFNLSFPYHGGTFGEVTIRKHPRYGKGVVFSVNKGQLLCGIADGCSITVRFDNNKPIKFHAAEPADHSNTYLFISPYEKFVSMIRKSSSVVIEATFYQQGSLAFEFSTSGFPAEKIGDSTQKNRH
jgi:hypothetical protein